MHRLIIDKNIDINENVEYTVKDIKNIVGDFEIVVDIEPIWNEETGDLIGEVFSTFSGRDYFKDVDGNMYLNDKPINKKIVKVKINNQNTGYYGYMFCC